MISHHTQPRLYRLCTRGQITSMRRHARTFCSTPSTLLYFTLLYFTKGQLGQRERAGSVHHMRGRTCHEVLPLRRIWTCASGISLSPPALTPLCGLPSVSKCSGYSSEAPLPATAALRAAARSSLPQASDRYTAVTRAPAPGGSRPLRGSRPRSIRRALPRPQDPPMPTPAHTRACAPPPAGARPQPQ